VTVIVSVKINDGFIMASDSASTFAIGRPDLPHGRQDRELGEGSSYRGHG
jgi:hypothetical protein